MKKNILLAIFSLLLLTAFSQAPFQLNYQAVVRDNTGQPVTSGTSVALTFNILNNSATGGLAYTETIPTTANEFGLVNVQIGSTQDLSSISWSTVGQTYFLQVKAAIAGGAVTDMGTTQLISVPYALYAGNNWGLSGNAPVNGAAVIGTTNNEPLNFVVNKNPAGHVDATAAQNTSLGYATIFHTNSGVNNTALGFEGLFTNTSGSQNTAIGNQALFTNSIGISNTACGASALFNNNQSGNTAVGDSALYATTASEFNVAVGYHAGTLFNNGYNNVFVGANTDVNGAGYFNVISIGQGTVVTASDMARFGNSATSSIGGQVDWTTVSDGRYKSNIKEDVKGLDFIMKLRPVTYNLNASALSTKLNESQGQELSEQMKSSIAAKEKMVQSGFIAQEVEQAAKDAAYDFSGVDKPKNENDIYGLRYASFVVPLVKAVQELNQKVDDLQQQIQQLKGTTK